MCVCVCVCVRACVRACLCVCVCGDNGRIYQIKIYKEMLTPNYGCVGATYKFTCSVTVFASLLMCFTYVDNRTTILLIL